MPTTRIKGGKRLEAFLRKAKNAKSTNNVKEVEVGFYSTARYPPVRTGLKGGQKQSPVAVTNVALWQEFGTWNIPERPFFRTAILLMQTPQLELLKAEINPRTMVVTRRTANKMGMLGKRFVAKEHS